MCPHVNKGIRFASAFGLFCFVGGFGVWFQQTNKEHTYIEEGEGALVLCKTPRVSVFGPHTRESLAEAKWTKVNKSGHYVWAPVNSSSLVSLRFKKRDRRCDHEESPCLFFSSHYRGGSDFASPPDPPFFHFSPFSALFPCFLFLQSSLSSSSFSSCRLALPAQCSSNMQEGERSMVSSERELHSWISMRTEERKRKGEQVEAGKACEKGEREGG